MSRVLTNEKNYYDIADTIRQMKNVNTTYKPREMASALKDIYSNEVEGTLPLSFEANGNFLLDYRIDGANGGVGDRTGNLVDKTKFVYGYRLSNIGTLYTTPSEQNLFAVSEFIEVNSGEQYIISQRDATRGYARRISFYQSKNENSWLSNNDDSDLIFTIPNTATYLKFTTLQNYIDSIMLRRGTSLPTTYEPYGYKVPVAVSGKNLLSKLPDSRINKGIEYTNVNNLYLHIEGTSNAAYSQTTPISLLFKKGKYYINFYCDEQYKSKLFVLLRNNNNIDIANVYSSGASFELNNDETIKLIAGVRENNTTINTNMYIQIVSGITSQSTYEPYHEPTTTNIYLDNPIRTVEDEVEYIDYSEQKHHRVRKNLLQNTATTQTINGVTFTVNNDKSITCNGTATGTTAITINTIFSINSTKISGCPMGGSWSSFELDLLNINTNNVDVIDTGNGAVIQNENSYRVRIRIASGYTCNNLTFYPMIRKADIEDDTYEPYIEDTEVDVTLPAIPTLDGTNVLTIDTTIQPSNVYVQAPKDSIEATMIANALEEI